MTAAIRLALGSNVAGSWGAPLVTLRRALEALESAGVSIDKTSSVYITRPLGMSRQPHYYNMAIQGATVLTARQLLAVAKRLERAAGRRYGRRWGARPLDIDIIDYAGQVTGWPSPAVVRPNLVLPHPEAHRRGFVLVPLAEISPHWRHPVLGLTAGQLLRRCPELGGGVVANVPRGLD